MDLSNNLALFAPADPQPETGNRTCEFFLQPFHTAFCKVGVCEILILRAIIKKMMPS
jgi:hypothetical protein